MTTLHIDGVHVVFEGLARLRWAAYRQRGYELKAFDAERRVAL